MKQRNRRLPSRLLAMGAVFALFLGSSPVSRGQGSDVLPFTLSMLGPTRGGQLPMAQVNNGHGCKGGNSPPLLAWAGVPAGAKSLALTLFDPTARHGAGFWHWALFDLPADLREYKTDDVPNDAISGRNDFGEAGFGGACPPTGEAHSYSFTVWALPDAKLPFDAGSTDKEIGAYLAAHQLGRADLTFTYKR